VDPSGRIVSSNVNSNGWEASLNSLGNGLSGNSGIPGVRSPLGTILDRNKDLLWQQMQTHLDVDEGKKADPSYLGPPD